MGAGLLLGVIASVAFGSLADLPASSFSEETSAADELGPVAPAPPPTTSAPTTTAAIGPAASGPTTTVPADSRDLVIHATGDVNLDPRYVVRFATDGYDAFDRLDGLFVDDDLTIVNLECAPSMLGSPLDKEFVFRCPPSSLRALVAGGVEVVNLANNHAQDYGTEAMLDGVIQARLAGLHPVGVGADLSSAISPALFEVNGWTIAVLGMGGVVPNWTWLATDDGPGMASGDDIEQMTVAVAAADEVADLVLVTIHWGVELEAEPRPDDVERARAMIAAGADAVFGHHSHRLGRVELVDGRPVFWTLGNFVWPRMSDASAATGVARLEISGDGEIDACILPAFIEQSGQPVLTGATECHGQP